MAEDIRLNVVVDGEAELRNLSASLKAIALRLNGATTAAKGLNASQRALNAAMGQGGRGAGAHAKNLGQLLTNQSALRGETKKLAKDSDTLANALKRTDAAAIAARPGLLKLNESLQATRQSMRHIQARAFISDIRGISLSLRKLGKDFQFVGRSLIIGLTTPLMLMAREALHAFTALDREMVRVSKVMNIKRDSDQWKAFAQTVENVSYQLGISQEILMAISGDFAELGLSEQLIGDLTELTGRLSILGSMEMGAAQELNQVVYLGMLRNISRIEAETGNLLTAVEKQEMAFASLGRQMAVFNLIENNTALSFRDMAESLPEVSAAANAFGLSFNQAVAILAPMKGAGINVSTAAHAMKTSFQRMVEPTGVARDIAEGLADKYSEVSDVLTDSFERIQGVGWPAIQGLIEFTRELREVAGDDEILGFYAKLFDTRQSPRMLTAIDDLIAAERELRDLRMTIPPDIASEMLPEQQDMIRGKSFFDMYNAQLDRLNSNINRISTMEDLNNLSDIANTLPMEIEAATANVGGQLVTETMKNDAIAAIVAIEEAFQVTTENGLESMADVFIDQLSSQSGKAAIAGLLPFSAESIAKSELNQALESFSKDMDKLKIAFKNLGADFLNTIQDDIRKLIKNVIELMEKLKALPPEQKKMLMGAAAALAALGPLVFVVGQAGLAMGVVGTGLSMLLPGLNNISVESLAAGNQLLYMKNGLQMMGDSVHNNNSKLTTMIAKLASTGGPVGKLALVFGRLTGHLSKSVTAAHDVVEAMDGVKASTAKALDMAMAPDASLGGAGKAGKSASNILPPPMHPALWPAPPKSNLPPPIAPMNIPTPSGLSAKQGPALPLPGAILTQDAKAAKKAAKETKKAADKAFKALQKTPAARDARREALSAATKGGVKDVGKAAVKPLTGTVNRLKGAWGSAAGASRNAAKTMIAQMTLTNIVAKTTSGTVKLIGFAWKLVNTIFKTTIIGIILTLLIGLFFVIKDNLDKIKESASAALPYLKTAWENVKNAVMTVIQPFINLFATIGGGAEEGVSRADQLKAAFEKVGQFVEKLSEIFQSIMEFIAPIIEQIVLAFYDAGKGIIDIVMGIVEMFKGNWSAGFSSVLKGLVGVAKGFVRLAMPIIKAIAWLIDAWFKFVKAVIGPIANALNWVVNLWLRYVEFQLGIAKLLVNIMGGAATGFVKAMGWAVEKIGGFFENLINALGAAWGKFFGWLASGINKFAGFGGGMFGWVPVVGEKIEAGIKWGGEQIAGLVDGIGEWGEEAAEDFADLVGGITDGITGFTDKIAEGLGEVTGFISGLIGKAGEAVGSFRNWFNEMGGVMGIIDAAQAKVGDFFKNIENWANSTELSIGDIMGDDPLGADDNGDQFTWENLVDPGLEPDAESAGSGAGSAFRDKFLEELEKLKQKFIDILMDQFEGNLDEVLDKLVEGLEKQKDQYLDIFDKQIEAIEEVEEAEQNLQKEREYLADRRRILEDRELNRLNYVRNRALAIYEGRIDDARMLDLEEQKSKLDSDRKLGDLDEKEQERQRKNKLKQLKEDLKEMKELTEAAIKENIEAFKEAAKDFLKFPPITIEEYEEQLNGLVDMAREFAGNSGDAFAEQFDAMNESLATSIPDIYGGFEGLFDAMVDVFDVQGVDILNGWEGILLSMVDMVETGLDGLFADVMEEHGPAKVLEEAIAFANESILREWRSTLGHIISEVDEMGEFMSPMIAEILRAQLAFEALEEAARNAGSGGDGGNQAPTGGDYSPAPAPTPTVDKAALRSKVGTWVYNYLMQVPWSLKSPYMTNTITAVTEAAYKKATGSSYTQALMAGLSAVSSANSYGGAAVRTFMKVGFTPATYTAPTGSGGSTSKVMWSGGQVPNFRNQGVPAMLHGGEFVMNSDAVRKIGLPVLESMNKMRFGSGLPSGFGSGWMPSLPGFQIPVRRIGGGFEGSLPGRGRGGECSCGSRCEHTTTIYVDNFIGEDEWFRKMLREYNMVFRGINDKYGDGNKYYLHSYQGAGRV